MEKVCANAWCQASFEVTDEDLAFYDKVSPVFGGKKFLIPPPTRCPSCREQRRLTHANRYNLYRRTSGITGNDIVSIYSSEKNLKVYETDIWWSDRWDPMEYGRDFSLTQPILPQLAHLFHDVPVMSLFVDSCQNSEYANWTGWAKNCYLCHGADYSEDCYYCESTYHSRDCTDCLYAEHLESCYECIDCRDCYNLLFSQNCISCSDSAFLFDCISCKHCFGCIGLRQKQYHYCNEQLDEQQYKERVAKYRIITPQVIDTTLETLHTLRVTTPHRSYIGTNNENIVGDYIYNSKNAYHCFDCAELEDCKYCTNCRETKDAQDVNFWGHPGELLYECMAAGEGASRVAFCLCTWGGTANMYYCFECIACSNCFGCSGLRHKQYCILNKQHTKEEYEALVPQIIEHMQKTSELGEFFPPETSIFDYNETLAQFFYPLEKGEVERRGWKWKDIVDDVPNVKRIIPAEKLPGSIDAIPDDVLNWAIKCQKTQRPFRITKQELDFYRRKHLPLPRFHPDERHRNRWSLRNPRKLWTRTCAKCQKPVQTTYAPDRPEIVYCEQCYLQAVY